jgi:hypothetical protein
LLKAFPASIYAMGYEPGSFFALGHMPLFLYSDLPQVFLCLVIGIFVGSRGIDGFKGFCL